MTVIFSKLLKEKDEMLSKLALSQLLCLVAVKETIHEEDAEWQFGFLNICQL
jgi:hypothetical protein